MSRPRPRPLAAPTMQIIATVLLRTQVRQNSVNGHSDENRGSVNVVADGLDDVNRTLSTDLA
jgi:hypothetical protein